MQARPERHDRGGGPRRIHIRGLRADAPPFDCVYLASIGRCLPTSSLDSDGVTELVVEDLCWCIAMAAWTEDRPSHLRRRARARWRAEGELLQARQRDLVTMAAEAGIRP
jgi:hypothetical protein